MKKYFSITLVVVLFLANTVVAQNENKPRMKVTSTGFSFGFAGAGTANTTEDYNNLKGAVNNPGLFIDASEYQNSQYNYGIGGNANPKIYLGLTPYSKKKGEYRYDRELRFSVGSGTGIRRSFNYYRYNNFTIDTFQSANTNDEVFADSSIFDRYIYTENFSDFNISVTYLFKTDVKRRVHFSAGVGVEYAYAFRAFVKVENYNEKSVIYYDPANKPEFNEPGSEYDFYSQAYNNQAATSVDNTNLSGSLQFARLILPLGINFRITNKTKSFFNKVYLFGEMTPGVEFQIVGNDKTYVNPYYGMALFGFSYRW